MGIWTSCPQIRFWTIRYPNFTGSIGNLYMRRVQNLLTSEEPKRRASDTCRYEAARRCGSRAFVQRLLILAGERSHLLLQNAPITPSQRNWTYPGRK
jgi:hypothetical protein